MPAATVVRRIDPEPSNPARVWSSVLPPEPYRLLSSCRGWRGRPVAYSEAEAGRQLAALAFAGLASKAARVVVASSIKNCW